MLFGDKKEWATDPCKYMDESQICIAKWKKPVWNTTCCLIIYMTTSWKKQVQLDGRWVVDRDLGGRGDLNKRSNETILCNIALVDTW